MCNIIGVWDYGLWMDITAWQHWVILLPSLLSSSPIFYWFQQHPFCPLPLVQLLRATPTLSTCGTFTQVPRSWCGQYLVLVPSLLHWRPTGAEYMEGEGEYASKVLYPANMLHADKQKGFGSDSFNLSEYWFSWLCLCLLCICSDGAVYEWDISTGTRVRTLISHSKGINFIYVSA